MLRKLRKNHLFEFCSICICCLSFADSCW